MYRRPTYLGQLTLDIIDNQSSLFTDAADAVKQMTVIDGTRRSLKRGLEL